MNDIDAANLFSRDLQIVQRAACTDEGDGLVVGGVEREFVAAKRVGNAAARDRDICARPWVLQPALAAERGANLNEGNLPIMYRRRDKEPAARQQFERAIPTARPGIGEDFDLRLAIVI